MNETRGAEAAITTLWFRILLVTLLLLLPAIAVAEDTWVMWTRSKMTGAWPDGTPKTQVEWLRQKPFVSEQVCRGSLRLTTEFFKSGQSGRNVVVDGDAVTFAPSMNNGIAIPANTVTGFCFPSGVDPSQLEKPWVMWSHGWTTAGERFRVIGTSHYEEYATCMKVAAETMIEMGKDDPEDRKAIETGAFRLICLPDTVDPRGPKSSR